MNNPFTPLEKDKKKPTKKSREATGWVPVIPIPSDAPPPPETHYKHGEPSLVHEYKDANANLLGHACRFDFSDGSKAFYPLTFCENKASGKRQWRWKSWNFPRPLYGLEQLTTHPDFPVIVCEGEKSAEACTKLVPDYVVVTSPNGSKAANKTDWSPLKGRKVMIWPDADEPGQRYAETVAQILLKQDGPETVCYIIKPPEYVPTGWDAADCLEKENGEAIAKALLFKAISAVEFFQQAHANKNKPSHDGDSDGTKKKAARNVLIELAEVCELWHDEEYRAYATVPVNGHLENMRINSSAFERWISWQQYRQQGGVAGDTAMKEAMRVLEAEAINSGKCYEPFLRIGRKGERVFVDLGQSEWNAISIGPNDWEVIEQAPVKFIRPASMKSLPVPERGELLEKQLRSFINVENDNDFKLILSWLVAALFDTGPYPVLVLNGEQGSAKSTLARLLRMLIDPNKATNRAAPREERDLLISAHNSWVLSLDNMSSLPNWLSDALCRVSSGGGYATRALRTDLDEVVLQIARPIILNGIPDLANRPDLGERAIIIMLPAIPDEQRRDEEEFWKTFECAWPFILGGLFDALSASLRNLPTVYLEKKPRMADFAKRITVAESGLGWEQGEFMAVYAANKEDAIEATLGSDYVAQSIREHITINSYPSGWAGTADQLLHLLSTNLSDNTRGNFLPTSPSAMGSALRRISPVLRKIGYRIEKRRSKQRTISIFPPEN